jgi:F-type H+-transporting ATPase subunit alpha
VGGNAQTKAMKQVAGRLRLDLAQYRELLAFTQFGAELDKATQAQLVRGERMVEILKQGQYEALPMSKQVLIIYAGTNGYLDDLPVQAIKKFETEFYKFIDNQHTDIAIEIETKQVLSDALMAKMNGAIASFKEDFKKRNKI